MTALTEPVGGFTLHQRLRQVADDYERHAAFVPESVDEQHVAAALRIVASWCELIPTERAAGR